MDNWIEKVAAKVAASPDAKGVIIRFPEYRPDLIKLMAHQLNIAFYDYRQEVMAPLGPNATNLTIEDLDDSLNEASKTEAIVIHNVEALLLVKQRESVIQWCKQFLTTAWSNQIILPVVILGDELAAKQIEMINLQDVEFPEQGLISRLLH